MAAAVAAVVGSTGLVFALEASSTARAATASMFSDNRSEAVQLFLAGSLLIGLAATVRRMSLVRAGFVREPRVGKMAAGER